MSPAQKANKAFRHGDFSVSRRHDVRSSAHGCTGTEFARSRLGPVPILLPELTADGLVLWRLRRTPEDQLWCMVGEFAGELALTLHDQASRLVPVAEFHQTIASVVNRAETLQAEFVTAGWEVVDVDLDEPD